MSARSIRPDELLQLAATLAGRGKQGAGRPRTVEQRRAVSTAYYALFHELSSHCVERAFGQDPAHTAQRRLVGRWIAHSAVRTLAVAATQRKGLTSPALEPVSADLAALAGAFST